MTNEQQSDATRMSLLSRAAKRDSQAWEQIVDLYGPLIAHWCYRFGLDSHQAADCVQDVFAALARSLATFKPQRESGSFRGWLWVITLNKLKDMHRRSPRHAEAAGGSTAAAALGQIASDIPEEEPSGEEQVSALMARALEQIRIEFEPRSWDIFRRVAIDKIATATVAEEFNITSAAVRQTRCRILRRLRQQLGDISDA